MKLTLAEHDCIDAYETIRDDIISNIFDMDASLTLVTDESSLFDFSVMKAESDRHIEKIILRYGIDLKAIGNYNILHLCRLIDQTQSSIIH
jgi:hypothetical protein